MSKAVFEQASPVLKRWLERCREYTTVTTTHDYELYAFTRDALGNGTIELIDNEDLSQGHDVIAMALVLHILPPKDQDEFLTLLSICEWTYNANIVWKDFDGAGGFAVQLKIPAEGVTIETLDALYKRLVQTKRSFEEG